MTKQAHSFLRHRVKSRVAHALLMLLLALPLLAEERAFRVLGAAEGLQGDHVLQMVQLADGRMAVVTERAVNLYDGHHFASVAKGDSCHQPLPGYRGYTRLYTEGDSLLWVKDWQTVACLDLKVQKWLQLRHSRRDFFVDNEGHRWSMEHPETLQSSDHTSPIAITLDSAAVVQDLAVADSSVYLFTADGRVTLYSLPSGRRRASFAAYAADEQLRYARTSLVVGGADSCFYQLRTGASGSVLLCFDRSTLAWRRLLSVDYPLHTLVVTPERRAYVACERGYWLIDLLTGEQHLLTQLHLPDGQTVQTGYNTICQDRDGGFWLGSYDRGLLYASPEARLFDAPGGTPWWVWGLAVAAIAIGAAAIIRRKTSRPTPSPSLKGREVDSLSADVPDSKTICSPPSQGGAGGGSAGSAGSAFLARATRLVEQNLRNTDYSVEQLASDLCMERTELYKKLTALSGQSPVQFIRAIRLERAAQLLREGGHTVAEVAEQTGFASAGYFTKCFQRQYGQLPSEFS